MWLQSMLARKNPGHDRGRKVQKPNCGRCDDEPPQQICHLKGNHYIYWCAEHTVEHLRRLLLWRGTLLHRCGRLMCSDGGVSSGWLYMVLGAREYEK